MVEANHRVDDVALIGLDDPLINGEVFGAVGASDGDAVLHGEEIDMRHQGPRQRSGQR